MHDFVALSYARVRLRGSTSVRPFVRLSHAGIDSKLMNVGLCGFHQCSHATKIESSQLHLGIQRDHLSRKPGNVREFYSCEGNVRYFTKSQASAGEKILSAKSGLKLLAAYLRPYRYLVGVCSVLNIKYMYMVLDHALLHSYGNPTSPLTVTLVPE